jgi:hypothetical protein
MKHSESAAGNDCAISTTFSARFKSMYAAQVSQVKTNFPLQVDAMDTHLLREPTTSESLTARGY